jgi:hypothetical protein
VKRRRIVTVLLLTAGLAGASTGAAQALGGNTTEAGGYWGCAGTRHVDLGICVQNPLPEQLPLPSTPSTPAAG